MGKFTNTLAVLMLIVMFGLMSASSWNDSAIFDEVAHIGAGYTYLKYQDGRLNPEHPPLLKSLAALPLMFLSASGRIKENITAQPFWKIDNVNDRQWAAGNYLLYESENNADQILFWSRLPMILLTILFGWILFWWVKKRYSAKAGLLTLFFYIASPTFLAHGRYVTTDVGAAFGFFLGIIFFLRFLEKRDAKSLIYCGLIFGLVNLFKFSLILLLPVYLILGALWILFNKNSYLKTAWQIILIGLIALAIIYAAYIPQIWNYQRAEQIKDAQYILAGYQYPSLAKLDFWLAEHRLTRPIGLYAQGFLMMARRTAGGNTAYFEGELSSKGWWLYFPTLALTKEQLGFYILALIAFLSAARSLKPGFWQSLKPGFSPQTASFVFIIFYWISSILNPLNIGVRHVLPTFPFLYFLVAKELSEIKRNFVIVIMMLWMVAEIIFAFPYFLSYYNELGGGLQNGYKIATDSNYDWGQDLKRLTFWAEVNSVNTIFLDYFGGGSPKYYLGEKYEPWWSAKGPPPADSYFVVSLNSLVGNQAKPIGDIVIKPEDSYSWLKGKDPIARAGSSILIYRF
ncbi:MAG: glycosyltransferase family 39 protein [Candidatus Giovannonibacteria bacterium]|nr:glycosyltransferase family 39 protein [Candidatus Giovannonibacteria bacterium]